MIEKLLYRVPHLIVDEMKKQLMSSEKTSLLDLGCGTGLIAKLYKKNILNDIHIVGVDMSSLMIDQAKDHYDILIQDDIYS